MMFTIAGLRSLSIYENGNECSINEGTNTVDGETFTLQQLITIHTID